MFAHHTRLGEPVHFALNVVHEHTASIGVHNSDADAHALPHGKQGWRHDFLKTDRKKIFHGIAVRLSNKG